MFFEESVLIFAFVAFSSSAVVLSINYHLEFEYFILQKI